MQTFFNREELELVQNKLWFKLKAQAADSTISYLNEIEKIIKSNKNYVFNFPGSGSKITRGENLKGYPYFVLDVPKMQNGDSIFSLRIIVWWGNYISVNLLLGESVYAKFREKIKSNISLLQSSNFFVGMADDHWQHDVMEELHYIKSNKADNEFLDKLKIFKITSRVELGALNNNKEVLNSVDLLNRILT